MLSEKWNTWCAGTGKTYWSDTWCCSYLTRFYLWLTFIIIPKCRTEYTEIAQFDKEPIIEWFVFTQSPCKTWAGLGKITEIYPHWSTSWLLAREFPSLVRISNTVYVSGVMITKGWESIGSFAHFIRTLFHSSHTINRRLQSYGNVILSEKVDHIWTSLFLWSVLKVHNCFETIFKIPFVLSDTRVT